MSKTTLLTKKELYEQFFLNFCSLRFYKVLKKLYCQHIQINIDASKLQLGAVISHNEKPITFYSRKPNSAQVDYTITERKLLSIVESLKEFRNIRIGQQIAVYTDHKNLTYKTFNTEQVIRLRLFLKEYSPELIYIVDTPNPIKKY